MTATLGIDLASQPERTAVCVIEWLPRAAEVTTLRLGADDGTLVELIGQASKTGIDAPLGWPVDFVRAMADPAAWPVGLGGPRRRLERRATDFWIHEQTGKLPLSVSTDRIAYPAMRAGGLLAHLGPGVHRAGVAGPVCEAYPDPSIRRFGLWPADVAPRASYKGAARDVRARIVAGLPAWLAVPEAERCVEADDCLDALICALVARAVQRGATTAPPPELAGDAAAEGWIHLPVDGALDLLL